MTRSSDPTDTPSPAGLARLDEFELIRRLAARAGGAPPGVMGIGDDAAAIPCERGWLLLTCDIAVEGRHFLPGRTPMRDVGWKVATANVSDVVACGGRPAHALVSLTLPEWLAEADLDALYDGLAEAAAHYGFGVVGGNVSGAGTLVADVFMTGRAPRFVARGGARPGHRLAVSGTPGDSAAGLELLRRHGPGGGRPPHEAALLARHLRPRARLDLADAVAAGASAAIDISDGLSSEVHHLARASGVRLHLERGALPCSEALRAFAGERGEDPLQRVLTGGEDYELLFTFAPAEAGRFEGRDVTVIGEVGAGEGVSLSGEPLAPGGWDHLGGR